MKRLASLSLVIIVLATACTSLNRTAYVTVGSVEITVDAAMQAWVDYARAGNAMTAQIEAVHSAYDKYFSAMTTAHNAVIAYENATVKNEPPLQAALDAASSAASDIVGLIRQFLPPEKAAKLKPVTARKGATTP